MMLVTAGAVDVTTYFHLRLAADGTDATGLTITNIDLQYTRSGATPAAKVDATALGAANSAHSDNTAFEIDSTDQPGVYRVDWPDAAFAAGVDEVILTVKCATVFTESLRVRLMSATRGLAGTALPAAAADAAGGLPISDAGGLDLDTLLGRLTGNVATAAKLLSYFQSALRKDVTVDPDIGGNYDDATDSQEAIRDRGDAAWITATGFSTHSAADVATAVWSAGSRTLTSISGLGIALASKLTKYVQLLARKDSAIATDNATELTEINADGGSGSGGYANTTDALEAVRDRGDAAWTTASVAGLAQESSVQAVKTVTDKVDDTLEDQGGGVYGFTEAALQEAPTGGSAPTAEDNAAAVRTELATELGRIDVATSTRATPAQVNAEADQALADYDGPTKAELDSAVATLATAAELAKVPKSDSNVTWNATAAAQIQSEATDALNAYDPPTRAELTSDTNSVLTAVGDVPTNAELATALATADDAILAAIATAQAAIDLVKAKTDNLPSDPADQSLIIAATNALASAIAALNNLSQADVRSAVGLGSANLDTQLSDLPTNAEMATLLAAADDAVLAAIGALNNVSATQVADAILKRDWADVSGEASRSLLNALRFLRNKWSIAGGVLTVTKEDDAATAWTAQITQTAGNPVTGADPD